MITITDILNRMGIATTNQLAQLQTQADIDAARATFWSNGSSSPKRRGGRDTPT